MTNYTVTSYNLLKQIESLREENVFLKARYEHDIASCELAEESFKKANLELEKSNAEKDRFICLIAHELKNPFHGLLGFAEMLDCNITELSSEEIATYTRIVRSSAENLYKLVESLLEWARLKRNLVDFSSEEMSLQAVFSATVESIRLRASRKGIIILNEISHSYKIYADKTMVASVFRNLLTNAIKFSLTDGKVIAKAKIREDAMIEISVTDTGIGIPEDTIVKLFKIDKKVGTKGTDNEPSTGLGLLLCKEFVEKHGGNIWVKSEEGKGSTFFFTLPGFVHQPAADRIETFSFCND